VTQRKAASVGGPVHYSPLPGVRLIIREVESNDPSLGVSWGRLARSNIVRRRRTRLLQSAICDIRSEHTGLIWICEWPISTSGIGVAGIFHPERSLVVAFKFTGGPCWFSLELRRSR
jgi:hypothetical protein